MRQPEFLAVWKPGMSFGEAVPAMASSLMMVLTADDPPRLTGHAVPLRGAAGICIGGLLNLPRLRDAPLPVVALFVAGCAGALLTRGWGHEGRFSIHLYGAASALFVWGLAALVRRHAVRSPIDVSAPSAGS